MASSFVFGHHVYLFTDRAATSRYEVWILTLPGWLHVTDFVLALGLATVPGGRETSGLTEGLVRPPLTLLNVDSCNVNSCCHQISFLGQRIEVIGELCVWTEVENCISVVDQSALHSVE